MSRCRSCQAELQWCVTEGGKTIPVDPMPDPRGNLVIFTDKAFARRAFHEANQLGAQAEGWTPTPDRFVAHFATCPQAGQHRRPR